MIEATNNYAISKLTDADVARWREVTMAEMLAFFAMILHMSLVNKDFIDDYFSTHPLEFSTFTDKLGMTRSRFRHILRYLHVSNNGGKPPEGSDYDPIYKVRPFYEHLMSKLKIFTPGANLTLGRVNAKTYKKKQSKYGCRFEGVADAHSGIICHMSVCREKGAACDEDVTTKLLDSFREKNHRVYMNRRYASPDLFKTLLAHNIFCVGTVSKDSKNLPEQFNTAKLARGERVAKVANGILAVKWRDCGDVLMLSTVHKDDVVKVAQRQKHPTHPREAQRKPSMVADYNVHKTGVDKYDQLAAYYPFNSKHMKLWKKLFFQIFQMGVIHAHKFFLLANSKQKMSLKTFMMVIGNELSATSGNARCRSLSSNACGPKCLRPGDHFPKRSSKGKRRCAYCKSLGVRHETSWCCYECDVSLCVACFKPYHTRGVGSN